MQWLYNFEEAREKASETQRVILLQFEMDGCKGCKKMNETTYLSPKVIEELSEWFVLLKQDLIKDREIRKLYGAYWTPAYYFIDNKGNSYYHFNGYLPEDEFRAMLRIGIAETIMPRGKYDDIIKIINKSLEELQHTSFYPKLLVVREIAQYIRTKNNLPLREILKEIQKSHPSSLEAKMYYWED